MTSKPEDLLFTLIKSRIDVRATIAPTIGWGKKTRFADPFEPAFTPS
jgi:hypothetical protein